MKGYKAFDKNLKCHDFQYEIGQTYEMDGDIECCKRGFHFCETIADCYMFYKMSDDTRICEVEAIGDIKTDYNIKYCTNKIKILSEVKNPKIKTNVSTSSSGYCNSGNFNHGNYNSGRCNSGDWNTGDHNSGYCNSGHWNSGKFNSGNWNCGNWNNGDYNSGDWNSGDRNIGHCNSGNRNSGKRNSGSMNSGDYNSGNYNSGKFNSGEWNCGNYNAGVFNCDTEPKIKMFDKESNWTMQDWLHSKAYAVMLLCPLYTYSGLDDEQEKAIFHEPSTSEYKQKWWDELSEEAKNAVKSLPNFDADKFYLCTGIRV